MAKEKPLTLSPEDRSRLEAITKARTLQAPNCNQSKNSLSESRW